MERLRKQTNNRKEIINLYNLVSASTPNGYKGFFLDKKSMSTERKAFNFYRSFYDVFLELPTTEQLPYITALLNRQFQGIEPNDLSGFSKFAYISQKHSIDTQIQGWEHKTGLKLQPLENQTYNPPTVGGTEPPCQQGKEKEKEKGKEKEKEKEKEQSVGVIFKPFDSEILNSKFIDWIEYRKEIKKPLKGSTLNAQIEKIKNVTPEIGIAIIEQSILNGWTGLFDVKGTMTPNSKETMSRVAQQGEEVRKAIETMQRMKQNENDY